MECNNQRSVLLHGKIMILIDEERCCYCGSCVAVCPQNIIELIDTYLRIDHQKCINCGICVKGCPVGVLTLKRKNSIRKQA